MKKLYMLLAWFQFLTLLAWGIFGTFDISWKLFIPGLIIAGIVSSPLILSLLAVIMILIGKMGLSLAMKTVWLGELIFPGYAEGFTTSFNKRIGEERNEIHKSDIILTTKLPVKKEFPWAKSSRQPK